MRVLQVCDTYPPDEGGLGSHVRRLSRQLVERGHEVTVVAVGELPSEPQPEDLFPVHRVGLSLARVPGAHEPTSPPFHPPWADPRFRRGLEELAAAFRPDVVHAHGWCVHSALRCAAPTSEHVVATLHDYNLTCPKKSLLRFDAECAEKRGPACVRCDDQLLPKRIGLAAALAVTTPILRRRIRRLIAVSGHVARQAERVGVPAGLIEVVPNFVDLPEPATASAPDPQRPYLLYVGPASPHKGRQVLLGAFATLGGDVGLRLVGGDGSASAPGIEDLGYRSGAELEELFARALALVVPSIWADPCPTVALEAMARGTPVIASASGGLTEIVEDGVTGILVPPGDAGLLGNALSRLAGDAPLRDEMGARGRERVAGFSTAAVLPRLEAIYGGAS